MILELSVRDRSWRSLERRQLGGGYERKRSLPLIHDDCVRENISVRELDRLEQGR